MPPRLTRVQFKRLVQRGKALVVTLGECLITLICVAETSFLVWGWLGGGFRRVNTPPCVDRLAALEKAVAELEEQLHADRNTLNRTACWVDYQRRLARQRKELPCP